MSLDLTEPKRYCNHQELRDMVGRMVQEIAEHDLEWDNLVLIGILEGGANVADYMAARLGEVKGRQFPVAYVDITLYRDDMIDTEADPHSKRVEIPFAVRGKQILLVDDVLFTGRTIRAALTSILTLGRPSLIRLAVVVDRGCRELPIQPDFVGCKITIDRQHGIRVRTKDSHPEKGIFIYEEG